MSGSMRILMSVAVLFGVAAAGLWGQSLLDNEYYKRAMELQGQSEQAFEEGDYDGAAGMAREAKENFAKSDAYVQRMLQMYRANGWLQRANERLAYAKGIKAEVNFAQEFEEAARDALMAKVTFDAGEYPRSIFLSKEAIAALQDIREVVVVAPEPEPVAEPEPTVTPEEPQAPPLPKQYMVQLILPKRDCFWRIAGYPFVYNDPWKWKILFKANKSVLENPENPDLIEPGQVFTIPSLKGEVREGEYDPQQNYTPFSSE
jgi:hypothetical protein